jgi:hypothetical protein
MSQTIAVPSRVSAPSAAVRRSDADRRFYLIAASLMLFFTVVGFRQFLQHGHNSVGGEVTAEIMPLVVVHGLAMFGWVVVFFLQTSLIQTGRRKLHMVIGPFAVALAAAVVILGSVVAGLSVHFNPAQYEGLGGAKPFLATMWMQMILFGGFVGLGWWYRRKAAIHRPMMLLATLVMQSGSMSRCPYFGALAHVAPLYVWNAVLIFGALLFLLQWALSRTANRAYLIGYAGIVLAAFLSAAIGTSPAWTRLTAAIIP